MCNHAVAMEVTREITLDADIDEVRRLVADPDELAGWVGDELRDASVEFGVDGARWTWAPDGVPSSVEVTFVGDGERTTVRVVERRPGPATSSARACTIGDAWDDRLLGLELRCLQRALRPIPA